MELSEIFYVDLIGFKILNLITKTTEYHGKPGKRADITTKYGKKPKNSDLTPPPPPPPPKIGYPLIYVCVMALVGVVPLGAVTHPPTARVRVPVRQMYVVAFTSESWPTATSMHVYLDPHPSCWCDDDSTTSTHSTARGTRTDTSDICSGV